MIYAVGDIHGQHEKLCLLLNKLFLLPIRDEDQLVFLGDYVDRGPDTQQVLDKLIALRHKRPNTVFLRGNHEQMMMVTRSRFDPDFTIGLGAPSKFDESVHWFSQGGAQTLSSYEALEDEGGRWWQLIPDSHWKFIKQTQMEYKAPGFYFVHAGLLPPGETWENEGLAADPRLWIREPFLSSNHGFGGRVVVFGHTVQRDGKPKIEANKIALDTGAAYGGPLTAVRLDPDKPYHPDEVEVYQV